MNRGTQSYVIMSIAMIARGQDFFMKLQDKERTQKLQEWVKTFFNYAKKMKMTKDDITDFFATDIYQEMIKFKEGKMVIEPDKEIMDLMKRLNLM